MKNAGAYAKKFDALMRRIKARHRAEPIEPAEPVSQLILAFLEWNASRQGAAAAFQRIMSQCVDINELRVSYPHEIVAMLGNRYPMGQERAERIRETLNDIFERKQLLTLDFLKRKPKREVRACLDNLPGMPPYVAAQVTLLCFDGHAIPVDDQLSDLLTEAEAVAPDASLQEIEAFLERYIRADDAIETHNILRAWVDAGTQRVASATSTRKTTKKKVSKKSKRTVTKKKQPSAKQQPAAKKKSKTVAKKKTKTVTKKKIKKSASTSRSKSRAKTKTRR